VHTAHWQLFDCRALILVTSLAATAAAVAATLLRDQKLQLSTTEQNSLPFFAKALVCCLEADSQLGVFLPATSAAR
jgi:hypothetical protein